MGDEFHRPHFHYLFYDLEPAQMDFIRLAWSREFGFCDVHQIPVLNRDGSPAQVKVSKYVAKYLHKPKADYLPLIQGLCESPRRVSSRGFGDGVLPDSLASFYRAEDCKHLPDEKRFEQILERKKSLVIDGVKFPLPRRISDKYFRYECKPEKREHVSEKTGQITFQNVRKTERSTLSLKVSNFARDRYLQGIIDKFRQYSASHSDEGLDRLYKTFVEAEERSLEDRAQYARKLYLQHLKKQKYG